MDPFVDHYRVLQVSPDAESEVIQSAYKRLCRKYHPDVNASSDAAEKMTSMNLAYGVLSDDDSRRAYHIRWRAHQAPAVRSERVGVREARAEGTPEARHVVESYFSHLARHELPEAYELLCPADRKRFTSDDFLQWQNSVAALYVIGSFEVTLFRKNAPVPAKELTRLTAEEYRIQMSEKMLKTGRVSEYAFTKVAVMDGSNWYIYLGYQDLLPLKAQMDEVIISGSDESLHDSGLGRSEINALRERVGQEVYRFKRYGHPFALSVFSISDLWRVKDASIRARLLKYVGFLLNHYVRAIDSVCYLDDGRFGVVLAEVSKSAAQSAAARLLKSVRHDVATCFDAHVHLAVDCVPYAGQSVDELMGAFFREREKPLTANG